MNPVWSILDKVTKPHKTPKSIKACRKSNKFSMSSTLRLSCSSNSNNLKDAEIPAILNHLKKQLSRILISLCQIIHLELLNCQILHKNNRLKYLFKPTQQLQCLACQIYLPYWFPNRAQQHLNISNHSNNRSCWGNHRINLKN